MKRVKGGDSCQYVTRIVASPGGKAYEFRLDSLPASAQSRYWDSRRPQLADAAIAAANPGPDPEPETGDDLVAYVCAADYNKRRLDKYSAVLDEFEGLTGAELAAAVDEWNRRHEGDKSKQTSVRSVYRARREKEAVGMSALLGRYGRQRGAAWSLERLGPMREEAYSTFVALYLRDSRPSADECRRITRSYMMTRAADYGPEMASVVRDHFPDAQSLRKAVYDEYHESGVYRWRYGQAAWERKFANYIDRDDENVRAGKCWVSDHHQLDEMWTADIRDVSTPYLQRVAVEDVSLLDGTLRRPWLTVWRDYKTGMWLSWEIRFAAPNADRIMETFAAAVDQYGAPDEIIIDNGKDYRSRDFAGGRMRISIDEASTRSMMAVLGVRPHFAWPYHGQSKNIERDFRTFDSWKSRFAAGYTGNNAQNKPESLSKARIRRMAPAYDEGLRLTGRFIDDVWHSRPSQGKNLAGRSRVEAWTAEYRGNRRVTPEALALLTMRTTTPRLVGRNGIRGGGYYWYGPWCESLKSTRDGEAIRVYLRLPKHPEAEEAWAFREDTGEFVGRARANVFRAPGLAKSDEEKQALADRIGAMRGLNGATPKPPEHELYDGAVIERQAAGSDVSEAAAGRVARVRDAVGFPLAEPVCDERTGEFIADAGERVTEDLATEIEAAGIAEVMVGAMEHCVQSTSADDAIARDARARKTGTFDWPEMPARGEKPPIYIWPSQRDEAEDK